MHISRQIEEMIRKGQEKEGLNSGKTEFTELIRSNEEEKVAFKFGQSSKLQSAKSTSKPSSVKSESSRLELF